MPNKNIDVRFVQLDTDKKCFIESKTADDQVILIVEFNITVGLAELLLSVWSLMSFGLFYDANIKLYSDDSIIVKHIVSLFQTTLKNISQIEVIQHNCNPVESKESLFQTIRHIIETKNISAPNFNDHSANALKKQINWIRSILKKNIITLNEQVCLSLIEKLKPFYKADDRKFHF